LERELIGPGSALFHTVADAAQLEQGWAILVDLHQRRRQSLGEPGCFASPQFAAFHRDVAAAFLRDRRLRLHWLEWDGRPIAAEYHLAGDDAVYAYQAGIDPDALEMEPGRLISVAVIRQAIADGHRAIDFLRGDEPYKAHWRAEPRASMEFRVAARRLTSRCRHGVWLAGERMKQWVKGRLVPDAAPMGSE
jgi:CelD/BcsL family acetyltransferase involved in cellulose biosynthesis